MNRALFLPILLVIGCGDSGDSGSGGTGGSPKIVCPEVTPGQDEILVPEDRNRMIEFCGLGCAPFVAEVRRNSDGCAETLVTGGGEANCYPFWTAACEPAEFRLELVACVPDVPFEGVIADAFAECRVNLTTGAIVVTGSTFWPLGTEEWRLCSSTETQEIFCP